jgi:PAS domain S-box-containing protein
MVNEAIAGQILETTQRIERLLRNEAPGLRLERVEPPHLLLVDMHACLNWLCDALERKHDVAGSAPSEPVLPKVAGGFLELIEGLDAVFWLAEVETSRLLYVSRGCVALWGRSSMELRGQPHLLEAGIHPEDSVRFLRGNAAGLRRGPARDESCRILRPDGLVRHARIRTLPLLDGRGAESRVAGIAEDITAREEAVEQVRKDRAELRALASELVLTEERERRKLATDLHEGAHQALEVARLKLGMLLHSNLGPDAPTLREIGVLLEQGLEGLRSLTFELSPPVLHDLGLLPALQWLAEDFERRLGLRVEVADDDRAKPLEDRIRVLLFRSTRELLHNVAKHARVKRALVSLRREGRTLVLSVKDDGTGFDPENQPAGSQGGGYGLFSIRQRLEQLDGGMEVRSIKGRGTTVVLRAPLQQEKAVMEGVS